MPLHKEVLLEEKQGRGRVQGRDVMGADCGGAVVVMPNRLLSNRAEGERGNRS